MSRRSRQITWLCWFALTVALVSGRADVLAGPTVKFVLADGAKVSDIVTIVAKATPDGDVGIDKVEFVVDDQLKATDPSTPYSFDWDTLEEKEGSHTLIATAFDAKGRTARATVSLTVDNELAKGADAHAETALSALKEGDTAKATRYARRALKIDPTNFKAARALAGIYRANGDLARAVATLDKATIPANDIEARKELIALHIARADESGSTEEFLTECTAAIDSWKKVNQLRIDQAQGAGKGAEASIALGDAYFAAHDWPKAITAYENAGTVDTAPTEALDRHVLALIRAYRIKDATALLGQITRAKRTDDKTPILQALLELSAHHFAKARDLVQDGVDSGSLPAMIVRMIANLPVGKQLDSVDLADRAVKAAPDNPDALLAQAYVLRNPVDARRSLIRALAVDPAMPEGYALQAYLIMLSRETKRYEAADQILDFALKLDPNNTYSLMAKIVCLEAQKRPQEAEPLLAQVMTLDAGADVHVAQALNLSLLDKTLKITEEMTAAFKQDPEHWADVFVPKPAEMPGRVFRYRYPTVMSPATLFAGK